MCESSGLFSKKAIFSAMKREAEKKRVETSPRGYKQFESASAKKRDLMNWRTFKGGPICSDSELQFER